MEKLKIMCTGEILVDFHQLKDLQLTEDGRSLKATSQEKIDKLAKSLKEYGIVNNLQVWKDGDDVYCFDAHHRKKALAQLESDGLEIPLLPATRCLAETIEEAKKLLILKESSHSWVDVDVIKDYLAEIAFDIEEAQSLIEIPNFEWLEDKMENKNDPDKLPDEPVRVVIKLGDLIELGDHRLLCGDSTDAEQVGLLMGGEKADMVFTDPPYGVGYQSNMRTKSEKFEKLKNDDVFLDIHPTIDSFSNGWVFVWTSWKVQNKWVEKLSDLGYPSNMVIWYKPGGGIGDLKRTFSTDYEVALIWHRGAELCGKRIGSVWKINKDAAVNYLHPTQKPVELIVEAIDKTTNRNFIVLDIFLGSGSTLIACEKTNRKCYGMELDPYYVQIIIQRWCDYTGKTQIKINGKEIEWNDYLNQ